MSGRLVLCFCMLVAFVVNGQTINLRGKVTDNSNAPVTGATVTLIGQNLNATTSQDGSWEIKRADVAVFRELQPQFKNVFVDRGYLVLSLPQASALNIEMFDVKGKLLKRESKPSVKAGFYRFNIAENSMAAKVLIIRAAIGGDVTTFRYVPLQNGSYTINQLSSYGTPAEVNGLQKIMAVNDTLKVAADGYKEKKVPITSYDQEVNIKLESNASGPENGSIGCGKSLSDLTSGTWEISSAGLNRKYIISIPDNYDPNKPYKLLFGIHCMGASAEAVRNDKFYRMKDFDTEKNFIWIAPQGYTDSWPWRTGDNKDHTFFDDMLKIFKEKLCIDTTRIFACGFSFGAMESYSLSLNHQNVFRAIATYAPANYNIYLPQNTHGKIAYLQTHGLSDGTCPWDRNGQGGKYCVITHAQDNGCSNPTNVPTIQQGASGHYCYEFQGCSEGYPVRICTFNDGHTDVHKDPNQWNSWIPKETWDFFNRF